MPLSEFYRMAKGKLDSTQDKNTTCSNDLSFAPENDFVELVWENGQILMQGQSRRTRKPPTGNSLLPSHIPKPRDSVKYGKFGTLDCAVNEFQMPGPSGELGLNQDDDMVPWLNYSIDESLQHGYCSEFMPELSGVTGNEVSAQNQLSSTGKRYSGNLSVRSNTVPVHNGVSSEQGNVSKVSCAGNGVAIKPRSSTSHLYPSSPSQQCQTSYPSHRSKVSDSIGNNTSDTACRAVSRDSPSVPQKQDPVLPPSRNSVVMNFSHFSRPAALVKANVQSNGVKSGMGLSGTERKGSKDKASVTSGNNVGESTLLHSSNGLQKETSPSRQPTTAPQKVNLRPSEDMPLEEPVAVKQSEFTRQENDLKDDKNFSQIGESSVKGPSNGEKATEPVVVCSSVCSGNSIDRPSDDATHNSKRKSRDNEDSECPSEDAEEESMDVKRAAHARAGTSSKRSRAAEVHNLSERRRRDRINEKMRSLQELIPNCNKVDKASMLDEAIEYLKTLQLQVQIMSMGAGLYMPQMMFPPGMQQLHAAHMGHFSPMVGMGMGMGIGMGMHYGMGMPDMNGGASGCPMIQVPPMQGAHFPGPPMSGPPSSMNGMAGSNLQLFGPPSQGIPMSMPRAPSIPLSGDPPVRSAIGQNPSSAAGPTQNVDSSLVSGSKDLMLNINSQAMQTTCINSSMNQTSSQCRATQKDYEPSALVQNNGQVADVKAGEAVNSSK